MDHDVVWIVVSELKTLRKITKTSTYHAKVADFVSATHAFLAVVLGREVQASATMGLRKSFPKLSRPYPIW